MLTAGLLLVGGAIAGLAGASVPALARVWTAPLPDKLRMIAERPRAWWRANVLFLVAIVTTAGGLSVLAALITEAGRAPAAAGMGLVLVGTALWAVDLAFRLTLTARVANEVGAGGAMPDWYPPASRWSWSLLIVYMLCASAALIAYGLAVVRSALLPEWSGWVAMAAGALYIVGTVVRRDTIPVLIQLVTLLLGILLLLA
jgi:hypothetical protein